MQINQELCVELGITVGEYLWLLSHFNKNIDLSIDSNKLKTLGLLDEFGVTDLCAQKIYTSPISDTVDFVKVYDTYPHKNGTRVFKSLSHDSENFKYCLNKFKYYVRKDPDVANKMLKGIINEILLRKKGGTENFYQDIKTWFNQRTWEKYYELNIEDEKPSVNYEAG